MENAVRFNGAGSAKGFLERRVVRGDGIAGKWNEEAEGGN
jgi:hypothetical protein